MVPLSKSGRRKPRGFESRPLRGDLSIKTRRRPKPSLRDGGPPGLRPVPHRAGALGRSRLPLRLRLRRGLFDRHADEGAPLGPRPVVIPYTIVPQQISKDEPGVSASFADAAVRDCLALAVDALAR